MTWRQISQIEPSQILRNSNFYVWCPFFPRASDEVDPVLREVGQAIALFPLIFWHCV